MTSDNPIEPVQEQQVNPVEQLRDEFQNLFATMKSEFEDQVKALKSQNDELIKQNKDLSSALFRSALDPVQPTPPVPTEEELYKAEIDRLAQLTLTRMS